MCTEYLGETISQRNSMSANTYRDIYFLINSLLWHKQRITHTQTENTYAHTENTLKPAWLTRK